MPIYEFKCLDCRKEFEAIVFKSNDEICCPECEGKKLEKLMSACRYPILYLDFLLSSCRSKARVYEHEQVLSRLFNTLALTNIAVVWGGRCRATGDTLLRLLLSRIMYGTQP